MSSDSRRPDLKRGTWGVKIAISLGVAALVYLALSLWAGWEALASHLGAFDLRWFIVALGLASFNFCIRFVRYHLFLLKKSVRVPLARNFLYHIAGLSLTMTPGKVGEVIKSWFLYREGFAPEATLPTIFMERFTDLLAVLFLASLGVFVLNHGVVVFTLSAVLLGVGLVLLSTGWGVRFLTGILGRLPLLSKKRALIERLFANVRDYMTLPTLLWSLVVGVLGWGAEALAFYFIAHAAGVPLTLFEASFIYSISTLAGVVFPGGLGGMEGMMGLLLASKGSPGAVVAIIFLIRLATLWWATLVGTIALFPATALAGSHEPVER